MDVGWTEAGGFDGVDEEGLGELVDLLGGSCDWEG